MRGSVWVASTIEAAYRRFIGDHARLSHEAAQLFAAGDFSRLAAQAAARIELHPTEVERTVDTIWSEFPAEAADAAIWSEARAVYGSGASPDREIAETFFNSVARRALRVVGVDTRIQFTTDPPPITGPLPLARHEGRGLGEILRQAVAEVDVPGRWEDLSRDLNRLEQEVRRRLAASGIDEAPSAVELLRPVFYRGRGAYLVGAFEAGRSRLPLVLALRHGSRGLATAALLTAPEDLRILFSYTRSPFLVAVDAPGPMVHYLASLVPGKPRAELYAALGFHHHAKTVLYRDLMARMAGSDERFVHVPGVKGLVMIVFAMPSHDFVFKVIRDRFPPPKQTTRRRVMEKYRLVFRHDRAGRLVEAHEFEGLVLAKAHFDPALLVELSEAASRSVRVVGDEVVLDHAYVERRVTPLDLYLQTVSPGDAAAAVVDYGRAIKNMAASNIFPGDMLLKNFGVTSTGRVVFYDYDELVPLDECRFRRLPVLDDPGAELAAEPWFGVGPNDIFPEELGRFLGVRGSLREVFDRAHGDLFDVGFWRRVQQRLRSGELIEIHPYRRSRRIDQGRGVRATAPS